MSDYYEDDFPEDEAEFEADMQVMLEIEATQKTAKRKLAFDESNTSVNEDDAERSRPAKRMRQEDTSVNISSASTSASAVPPKKTSSDTSTGADSRGVYLMPPPGNVECMTVTGSNGVRVYLELQRDLDPDTLEEMADQNRKQNRLLSTPLSELLKVADQKRIAKALQKQESQSEADQQHRNETSQRTTESELWVDKYSPKTFMELLTDEKTNRETLKWIKEWDNLSFQDKTTNSDASVANKQQEQQQKQQQQPIRKFKVKGSMSASGLQAAVKAVKQHRILLLAGPPGVGKTTLAHVIAKHAGYNPVEVNASDERTKEKLLEHINACTTMRSVFGNGKPNCLIMDEIDGAMGGKEGKSAIEVLVKIAQASQRQQQQAANKDSGSEDNKTKEDATNGDKTKATKRKGKSADAALPKLNRPIICICNDQYAAVLRSLRQVALVFAFARNQCTDRVVERLKQICRQEALDIPVRILNALAVRSEGDIRSCLNTLQFFKHNYQSSNVSTSNTTPKKSPHRRPAVSGGSLNTELLLTSTVGHKDVTKGYFEIWNDIFTQSKQTKQKQPLHVASTSRKHVDDEDLVPSDSAISSMLTSRGGDIGSIGVGSTTQRILSSVSAEAGDEKIIDGLFENYLNVRYSDPDFTKTSSTANWLCFSDYLYRVIKQRQLWTLQPLIAYSAVAVHLQCSTAIKPNLTFPRQLSELKNKRKQNQNIIDTLLDGCSTYVRLQLTSQTRILTELLPYITTILTPKIRPVSTQLLNDREKRELNNLIDTHIAYGLTYHSQFVDGRYSFSLDPNVYELIEFPLSKPQSNGAAQQQQQQQQSSSRPNQLSYALKQFIAHEIEHEKIRRVSQAAKTAAPAAVATIKQHPEAQQQQQPTAVTQKPSTDTASSSAVSGNSKVDIKATPLQKYTSESKILEFFGKSNKQESGSSANAHVTPTLPSSKTVYFKYHEGVTNAIKRQAKMRDFL